MHLKKYSSLKGSSGSTMESFIELWLRTPQQVQWLTVIWTKQITVCNIHIASHDCVFYYSDKLVASEATIGHTCLILQGSEGK